LTKIVYKVNPSMKSGLKFKNDQIPGALPRALNKTLLHSSGLLKSYYHFDKFNLLQH